MRKIGLTVGASAVALACVILLGGASARSERAYRSGVGSDDSPLARLIRWNIGRLLMLREEVTLTGEQRERVRDIVDSHRAEAQPVIRNLVAKRRVLRNAVCSDEIDEKAIRAASTELASAMGDAAVLGARVSREIRPVLTKEQFQALMQFREERDAAVDRWIDEIARGLAFSPTQGK